MTRRKQTQTSAAPMGGASADAREAQNPEAAARAVAPDVANPIVGNVPNPIGVSGLLGATPEQGIVSDEFLGRLANREGTRLYREMSRNDPIVHAFLLAIEQLVRGVTWTVEPENETPEAEAAADFIEECLFQDMAHPFDDALVEVLSMLVYGYAVIEPVFKVRRGDSTDPRRPSSRYTDGRIGLHRLAPRGQDTFYRWLFSAAGDVLGVVQQDPHSGQTLVLPADRILLFRSTTYKANPEGRSLLRGAVIAYLRKQLIEEAEGRAALRSAGVVTVRLPAKYMSRDASAEERAVFAAYKAAADRLAQDRQGSVTLPSDKDESGNYLFDISYIVADGRRPADMTQIIERLNRLMATSVLADFLLLGQQAVGSFALSKDKTDFFLLSIKAVLEHIKDVFSRTLIPRLFRLNGMDPRIAPTLAFSDLSSPDLQSVASFVSTMAGAGAPMFPDETLEDRLRAMAKLPTKRAEEG